jgi:hypothetical protein
MQHKHIKGGNVTKVSWCTAELTTVCTDYTAEERLMLLSSLLLLKEHKMMGLV